MLRNKNTKLLSEIADFFTSEQKAICKILELYRTMGISSFHIGVNDRPQVVYRRMDILLTLLLSPLANANGTGNTLAWFKKTMDAEKDVIYRFMNDCRLRWRSVIDGINCKLMSCMCVDKPADACLILDDTDLKKTGFKMELSSRIWSHVDNKALLGFKALVLGWCDGKSFLALDFSLHREVGKNEKFPCGLKPQQVKSQFHKERPSKCAGAKRVKEADHKKTESGKSMISRALFRGVPFSYVLMDSWFVSGKMIRFVLGLRGKHLLGMGKMGTTKYGFQNRELTSKELSNSLSRKGKAKRIRKLNMRCIQVNVTIQEIPVCLFFYRNTGKGPWHFLISTDLDLTPLKAYQLYARRWNIEVCFKEMKQLFDLNGCHSRDFDAQIAHVSVTVIAYNMFSTAKRLNSYETMGDLFREVAGQMAELTLSERIWAIIVELLQLVADLMDVDFAALVQRLMQKADQDSKLMRLITFSNANAA